MKTFYPSILTSKELYTVTKRMSNMICELITNDPFIDLVTPVINVHIDNLSKALSRTNDSRYVRMLESKAIDLNKRYISLRDHCKACQSDPEDAVVKAANNVATIIREIGWSMQLSGTVKKNSLMHALIARLEKEPVNADLVALKGVPRLEALKKALNDYENTYLEKIDAKTREEYPKIHNCRRFITRYIGALLNHIDIMDELSGGEYSPLTAHLDELITEFDSIGRSRQTRRRNKKEEKNLITARS